MRTIFTAEQLERLEGEFARQQYMVGPERLYLAHALRLTEAQVKVWFQNRRIKWRKLHHEQQSQRVHEFQRTLNTSLEHEDSNETDKWWNRNLSFTRFFIVSHFVSFFLTTQSFHLFYFIVLGNREITLHWFRDRDFERVLVNLLEEISFLITSCQVSTSYHSFFILILANSWYHTAKLRTDFIEAIVWITKRDKDLCTAKSW